MSISIILTTCNRPIETVKRAVDSVLAQTVLTDTHLIIVNDYPKNKKLADEIMELTQYASKTVSCEYIEMPENSGACKARNAGALKAKGDYIAFLDDDDIWMPDKLKLQAEYMKANDSVMVTGYVKELINGTERICNSAPKPGEKFLEKLLEYNFIGGCSVPLIRRDAFESIGGFDARYQSSQDYNLWIKLSKKGNVGFLEEVLVIYEAGENGITKDINKRKQGWNLILNDFESDYKKFPAARKNFCYIASTVMKENGRRFDSFTYRLKGKFGI